MSESRIFRVRPDDKRADKCDREGGHVAVKVIRSNTAYHKVCSLFGIQ